MDTLIQPALFHDRIEQALDEVITACGGRKKFAVAMWPDKPARDAHNLLDACLNPERRERFTPDQLVFILRRGREVGCHSGMRYLCGESGYSDPVPLNPSDQAAELQRAFNESVRVQSQLVERMERLTRAPLQAVAK